VVSARSDWSSTTITSRCFILNSNNLVRPAARHGFHRSYRADADSRRTSSSFIAAVLFLSRTNAMVCHLRIMLGELNHPDSGRV